MNNLQKVIAGLQIVAKYEKTDYDVSAEHDIIYTAVSASELMSEEDKKAMIEVGWSWNDGLECFYIFV